MFLNTHSTTLCTPFGQDLFTIQSIASAMPFTDNNSNLLSMLTVLKYLSTICSILFI